MLLGNGVHEAILLPTGLEVDQDVVDIDFLCGLPSCGGAVDGQ